VQCGQLPVDSPDAVAVYVQSCQLFEPKPLPQQLRHQQHKQQQLRLQQQQLHRAQTLIWQLDGMHSRQTTIGTTLTCLSEASPYHAVLPRQQQL
jgi:hypothetical protein